MQDTKVSLNEVERRAQYAKTEQKQLAIENARRLSKGEEQLKTLIKDDEDDQIAAAAEAAEKAAKLKPEEDAYLAETGRILLDWLSLAPLVSNK